MNAAICRIILIEMAENFVNMLGAIFRVLEGWLREVKENSNIVIYKIKEYI